MTNPTSNFGWQMPTSTDLVTDLPADFAVFGQAVDTSMADLLGGTTGQVLKKNSNTNMDFVWGTDGGMTNPMTTTGDTIYSSSGSTPARLGIGTTGQLLTVAGGVPTWATPAASGGTTLISEQVLSGSTGYQFASIPQTYKNLVLTWDGLNQSAISTDFGLRFNNASTTIYKEQYQYQETGSNAALGTTAGTTAGYACFGVHVTNTAAEKMALGQITIYDYASSTKYKYYQMQYSYWSNNNSRVNFWSVLGFFESTTAISTLDIIRGSGSATMSNLANTSVRLYGVS